jgi:hypothetical protein
LLKLDGGFEILRDGERYNLDYAKRTREAIIEKPPVLAAVAGAGLFRSLLPYDSRRFTRLTHGFSKKLDNHVAAVALYVAHYNLCRIHEALKATPAKALGVVDRTWAIGELIDAALATQPIAPGPTAPERRKLFRAIRGGRE